MLVTAKSIDRTPPVGNWRSNAFEAIANSLPSLVGLARAIRAVVDSPSADVIVSLIDLAWRLRAHSEPAACLLRYSTIRIDRSASDTLLTGSRPGCAAVALVSSQIRRPRPRPNTVCSMGLGTPRSCSAMRNPSPVGLATRIAHAGEALIEGLTGGAVDVSTQASNEAS